jgi:hypothetical protein
MRGSYLERKRGRPELIEAKQQYKWLSMPKVEISVSLDDSWIHFKVNVENLVLVLPAAKRKPQKTKARWG